MADARDYDFQIQGTIDGTPDEDIDLRFRGATSDRFPYVRATAPFRKEQFDSSGRAGDQSLTGWWTRGQLSFHKGGGVNYYEVSQDETALERSNYTVGCDISTPGQVSLQAALGSFAFPGYVPNTVAVRDHFITIDTSGVAYCIDPPYDGAPATVVTHETVGFEGEAVTAANLGYYYISGTVTNAPAVIERSTGGGTATEVVWTHHDINSNWDRIWWVKDRILAQTTLGELMYLSSVGGTTTSGDVFGTREVGEYLECVVGTPGPIVASSGTRLYAISVDESGPVPAPLPPTQIAELPSDESIIGLSYCLGHLVIVTERGVRVGVLQDTSLTYGPQVLALPNHSNSRIAVGVQGTSAYVPGDGPAGRGVYELDLATLVEPLRPAWSCRWAHPDPDPTPSILENAGVWVDGQANVIYADAGGATDAATAYATEADENTLTSEGAVLTGWHRFGTLEPKQFEKAVVRSEGFGQIDVYRQRIIFTGALEEQQIGTMDGSDLVGEFDLAMPDPAERVRLRFVLHRDTAILGPTLLGYQVKALPVPERQRILRWPLLLHDVVRLRRGAEVGSRGTALTVLQDLERLEVASAVVTYTDHRTGETGTAYIDSVEFQSDTPASKTTNGFGGIAYLTLRVIG